MSSILEQLQKRKVFRAVSTYAIACFMLLQILDVIGEPLGITNRHLQWLIAAMLGGFLLTTYLSWMFDFRPDSDAKTSGAKWPGAVVAGLACLLFGGGVWWVLQSTEPSEKPASPAEWSRHQLKRVAVLPLRDLSPKSDLNWLAAGITSELQRQIGMWEHFEVTPDAISRRWLANEASANTELFIDGNLQGSESDARVEINVIDSNTSTVLWSKIFENRVQDSFGLQTEIATSVARYFGETIGGFSGPANPTAYKAYLRYMEIRFWGDEEESYYWLEQTLNLDPNWSLGWANLALHAFRIAQQKTDETFGERGALHLMRAKEADAHPLDWLWVQEIYQSYWLGDYEAAFHTMRQITEHGGSAAYAVARLMLSASMFPDAERYYNHTTRIDPFSLYDWEALGVARDNMADFEGAAQVADRINELQTSDQWVGLFGPGLAYAKANKRDKALRLLDDYRSRIASISPSKGAYDFLQLAADRMAFEMALAAGDTSTAEQHARARPGRLTEYWSGTMLVRLKSPDAESLLQAATVPPLFLTRWSWPYAKQHLTKDLQHHPSVVAAETGLGFTPELRHQLCVFANRLPNAEGLSCDPADYPLPE